MYGQFLREKERMQNQRRWKWSKGSELKQETESLICAAQEEALTTNAVKMPLINRMCPLHAGSARRMLKVQLMFSVCVLS